MPSTATRLRSFTESVIREMTRIAIEHDAINLSQGFPDLDPPPALIEAAGQAIAQGHHQYAITWGAPRFRQADYARRRDLFLGYLDRAALRYTTPQGAYYVLVDISDFDFEDDTAFCVWLAMEIGVAAVPGSSFFREPVRHLVRLHFAKREETLEEAGNRLLRLKQKV